MPVRLHLLGTPRLAGGSEGEALPLTKPTSLLFYLACRNDWVSRSELAFLYRPDEPEAAALSYLRKLIFRARQFPWAVGLDLKDARLCWPVDSDVHAFRKALEARLWSEALEHYGGSLLSGLALPDAPGFTAWLELERSSLAAQWYKAVMQHAGRLEKEKRLEAAALWLERAFAHDPLDEAGVQRHLRVLALLGQRHRALEVYETFRETLEQELGVEPLEATQALADSIRKPRQGPTAKGLAAPRHNLPAPTTRFVGRGHELEQLASRLGNPHCRLLTLVGLGGMGKTRLALEAARQHLENLADGAWFVPLAQVASPELLPSSIARTLELTPSAQGDSESQLLDYLRDKNLLLLLDNFEHLLGGAALLQTLLEAAPGLKLLVTSRGALELSGEWLFDLGGLSTPPPDTDEALERYDAVRLFVDRAQRRSADFVASDVTLRAIATICRRVEGMPLALELAAAWTRTLNVQELSASLEHSLDALSATLRDVPERQRSIRAVFDYTWERLSPPEREVLAKLAVFRGGFTLEAAEAIADAHLALLLGLIDHMLVRRDREGRFDLHELVKHYAAEKLDAKAPERQEAASRHSVFYLEVLSRSLESGAGALRLLGDDVDNIHLAWSWCVHAQDVTELERRLADLQRMVTGLGRSAEGIHHFDDTIRRVRTWPQTPEVRRLLASLLNTQADLHANLGNLEQVSGYLERSLKLLGGLEDAAAQRADALTSLGRLHWERGSYEEARRHLEQALAQATALGNVRQEANIIHGLAIVARSQGNLEEAQGYYERALDIYRNLGEIPNTALALNNIGALLLARGKPHDARQVLEEGLALAEEAGARRSESYLSLTLAGALFDLAEYASALEQLGASLELARELGDETMIGDAQRLLGATHLKLGDCKKARAHLREGLRIAHEQKAQPRILACLLSFAELAYGEGKVQEALPSLAHVLHHPATREDTRKEAQAFRNRLAADRNGVGRDLEHLAQTPLKSLIFRALDPSS